MFRRPLTPLLKCCQTSRVGAAIYSRLLKTTSALLSEESSERFPTPNVKQLPVQVRERLHQAEDRHGFIPNFLRVYARRPKEFMAFYEYHDALMNSAGNLTRAEREMVALVTSAKRNCLYCTIAHSGLHRKYSKDPDKAEQLIANWRHADISKREKAILTFSEALRNSEDLTDEYFENLKHHGLDEDDAWNIASVVALTTMSGYMAHFMKPRVNQEFFFMGKNLKK